MTKSPLEIVQAMEAALQRRDIDVSAYFHDDFVWSANYGCGTKRGVAEFRRNWQLPIRAAFTERDYKTEKFIADGEWAACFGHIEATHSGPFMGIEATGRRVTIPYMDFWRVRDGRISDNPVMVDFPAVLAQLGRDVFEGQGWEAYDDGRATPSEPEPA